MGPPLLLGMYEKSVEAAEVSTQIAAHCGFLKYTTARLAAAILSLIKFERAAGVAGVLRRDS